jgi:hypothetical protein
MQKIHALANVYANCTCGETHVSTIQYNGFLLISMVKKNKEKKYVTSNFHPNLKPNSLQYGGNVLVK